MVFMVCSGGASMVDIHFPSITEEDVETFKRHVERERKTLTPEQARKKLIESGFLREDGSLRYPAAAGGGRTTSKHVNGKK